MRKWLLAIAGLTVATSPAYGADTICAKLADFVAAQVADAKVQSPRHWVEIHWDWDQDPNDLPSWSKGCQHSSDASSKELCHWLFEHSSTEFRSSLPIRVLSCYGYRFPKHALYDWFVWDGEFTPDHRKGRYWLKMELAKTGLPGDESALRLSVENASNEELPKIVHYVPDAAKSPK